MRAKRDAGRFVVAERAGGTFIVAKRDGVRAWVEDVLGALPELEVRRLFGGAGIYSGETIFGILYAQCVYLKTNEATRAAYVERGCDALRARSGNVLTSYYEVPADVLDDEQELLVWARRALEVASESPGPEPRRRSLRRDSERRDSERRDSERRGSADRRPARAAPEPAARRKKTPRAPARQPVARAAASRATAQKNTTQRKAAQPARKKKRAAR